MERELISDIGKSLCRITLDLNTNEYTKDILGEITGYGSYRTQYYNSFKLDKDSVIEYSRIGTFGSTVPRYSDEDQMIVKTFYDLSLHDINDNTIQYMCIDGYEDEMIPLLKGELLTRLDITIINYNNELSMMINAKEKLSN
jgi:hypothetical protein